MGECKQCGADVRNKNTAGHFRDYCHECIAARAGTDPDAAAPIDGCECPRCQRS